MQRQTWAAGAVTVVSIGVAVTVNLLTSGWSWVVFAVLAVLAAVWVALEVWRSSPRRERPGGAVVPARVDGFVPRPELTDQIVRALSSGGRGRVGITTTLAGAGGFGKTTLAAWVLRLPEVRELFPDQYWVTVGQEMRGAALADAVNDVIGQVTGRRPGFTSPEQAGLHLGGALAARKPPPLLVVDDVWTSEQLRPFLDAARTCTLLVTTRVPDLLAAAEAQTIRVDQMNPAQARDLLVGGLGELPDDLRERLLDRTGRWPLALRLANSALRRTARDGGDIAQAAERLVRRLGDVGPTALDVADPAGRERTVAATLESSLGVLGDRRDRAIELAIFPEDTEVPPDVVALLWHSTAGLSADDSERLCQELVELSLVERGGTRIRLHDVIRTYLRHECGPDRLTALHRDLLDRAAAALPDPGSWWALPTSAEYLWRWLGYHLNGAGRGTELAELATTPGWVTGKLRRLGPVAVAEDLALVATPLAGELARVLDRIGHLLVPGDLDHAVVNALAHRLPDLPAFHELRAAALAEVAGHPRLTPWRPLPDLPDPALNRVLVGHDDYTERVFCAPDGTWLATAGGDGVRVWHPGTGRLLRVVPRTVSPFSGDTCALSRDGRTLAVDGRANTTLLLDTTTWEPSTTVLRHGAHGPDLRCFTADNKTLVTIGDDKLVVWDVGTGRAVRTFKTPPGTEHCVSLDDGQVLTADDEGLKVWNLDAGVPVARCDPQRATGTPVVGLDGRCVAVPTGDGLLVWDLAEPARPPVVLHYHPNLSAAVFLPDGRTLATGDETGLIVLWDTAGWQPTAWIAAHAGSVQDLAVTPNGVLVSLGGDATVRLWNPDHAGGGDAPTRGTAQPDLCAAAADGSWLAVSDDVSVVVYDPATAAVVAELRYTGVVWAMTALGSDTLVIDKLSGMIVCRSDNWQASRSLALPSTWSLDAAASRANLVLATDSTTDTAGLWDVSTWAPPTFVEVGEELRPVAGPPAEPGKLRRALARKRGKRSRTSIYGELAPDGSWVALSRGDRLRVADPRTWAPIASCRLPGEVQGVLVSPDGGRLLVRSGPTLHMVDTATWKVDRGFGGLEWPWSSEDLAWSPDGTMLATSSEDRVLRVHDSRDGRVVAEFRLDGELKAVRWVGPDRLVVVGGRGVYWFAYSAGSPAS
ncbi:hypothetical protein GCM10010492_17500 [Saccharothrix mutabilis subsp. mutabilis]|uniref:NB-ARC domain-containing protein n=1 Tax=Saccharothrix mutabilis subsp. mutabilis TaxID=66855 RepID=A0ABN0TEY5_9PSEU